MSSVVARLSSRNDRFSLEVSSCAKRSTSGRGRCATASNAFTTFDNVAARRLEHREDNAVSADSSVSMLCVRAGNSVDTVYHASRSSKASISERAASAAASRSARRARAAAAATAAGSASASAARASASSLSASSSAPSVGPSLSVTSVETWSPRTTSGANGSMMAAIFESDASAFSRNAATSAAASPASSSSTTRSRSVSHAVTALSCLSRRLCFIAATPSRRRMTPLPPGPSSPSRRTSAAPSPNSANVLATERSVASRRDTDRNAPVSDLALDTFGFASESVKPRSA